MIDEQMEALHEQQKHWEREADRLAEKYPDVHQITLICMAFDYAGVPRIDQKCQDGEINFGTACNLIGSYARFEGAVTQLRNSNVTEDQFFEDLPDLWTSSDPDDSNSEFLAVWKEARRRKGEIIGSELPTADPVLYVYRGQMEGDFGFAWTLDQKRAEKFARGAGARVPQLGVVYRGVVLASDILAYLTGRHEEEIIVDPANVQGIQEIARWVKKEKQDES